MERFSNFATAQLVGSINASVTSITVDDGSIFPSSGDFSIIIGIEIMKVTARSSNTLTVVRGQDGTTGASHTGGDVVTLVLTKRSLDAFRSDNVVDDTYANMFSPTVNGRLYVANNAPYIARDDGTTSKWVAGLLWPMKKRALSDFTWNNQGSATSNETNGAIYIEHPGSSTGVFAMLKSMPTPPFTILMNFALMRIPVDYLGGGMFFRESATGKVETIGIVYGSGTLQVQVSNWTNSSTFVTHFFQLDGVGTYRPAIDWFRLSHNGTNISYGFSNVRHYFYDARNVAKNNYFTTGPDQVGFFVNPFGGAAKIGMMVNSWEEF
jgi:hypothetical protein